MLHMLNIGRVTSVLFESENVDDLGWLIDRIRMVGRNSPYCIPGFVCWCTIFGICDVSFQM